MMFHAGWLAVLALLVGCQEPSERLNAPPQGTSDSPHALGENYVHMTDNAMLSEMCISSSHFVPHTTELNTLGVRRLNRYAEILDVYGGTLHYDGGDPDEDFRNARLERIRTYLVACGLNADRFEVESGLNRGPGLDSEMAITIRKDTNFGGKVTLEEKYELGEGGSN
jgi:hypothetical protein